MTTDKRLIITADDFGISREVNEAVEEAYSKGVLTTTSLMVGGLAAADAIDRARALPGLAVGLHLAVSRARPVLPVSDIPDLVDGEGLLKADLVGSGFRFFFLPHIRKQLGCEIRAQFESFKASGLVLDHVNAHNHLHLHPTVLSMMIRIGRDYGLKAVRIPADDNAPAFLKPWLGLMRWRLKRAGIKTNDRMFGLQETGELDTKALLSMLRNLPSGVSEIMTHPAKGAWDGVDPKAKGFRFEAEFKALMDTEARDAIRQQEIELISFKDI